ncbi:hypothetical protein Ancab_036641 [Ancistrocladus abbreviatus]
MPPPYPQPKDGHPHGGALPPPHLTLPLLLSPLPPRSHTPTTPCPQTTTLPFLPPPFSAHPPPASPSLGNSSPEFPRNKSSTNQILPLKSSLHFLCPRFLVLNSATER